MHNLFSNQDYVCFW